MIVFLHIVSANVDGRRIRVARLLGRVILVMDFVVFVVVTIAMVLVLVVIVVTGTRRARLCGMTPPLSSLSLPFLSPPAAFVVVNFGSIFRELLRRRASRGEGVGAAAIGKRGREASKGVRAREINRVGN